jgi:hypothetical protein
MQNILTYAQSTNQISRVVLWEIADLVTCIGSIWKGLIVFYSGFPDYNSKKPVASIGNGEITVHGILVVLGKFNNFNFIRSAVYNYLTLVPLCVSKNGWMYWT